MMVLNAQFFALSRARHGGSDRDRPCLRRESPRVQLRARASGRCLIYYSVFPCTALLAMGRVPLAAHDQLNVTNGVITNVNDETAELRGPGQTDQHDDRLPQGQVRPAVRGALAPLALRYLMFCARALVGSEGKKPPVVK